MLGAIAGDMIGSVYEFQHCKTKDVPLFTAATTFTDDTIMTVAIADVLLHGGDYIDSLKQYGQRYPNPMGGYGGRFGQWLVSADLQPYNSWGNGSAMRVSPIGFALGDLPTVLQEAERSAAITHNHPEGIKGAQATAAAVFLARHTTPKAEIKAYIETQFSYDLSRSLDQIRPTYHFNESCQETVPQAIIAFLESTDFEDAIRNAISLGGDADTLTCITGAIADAFYGGLPESIRHQVFQRLDPPLAHITHTFTQKYPHSPC